jgi:hypothetical protein
LLALLGALLAGCGAHAPSRPGAGGGVAALDAALPPFSAARARLASLSTTVTAGATALDAADTACATGKAAAAGSARKKAAAPVRAVPAALRDLPPAVSAYRKALDALSAADSGADVDSDQHRALREVVARGRAEADAYDAFRAASERAWPRYRTLDAEQAAWFARASAGWYRTTRESADAYTVYVADDRAALVAARSALARADTAVTAAGQGEREAMTAADRALAPLRAPG